MITFDGISREVCTARRIRTNTPLQALTTLNDSAYIDMARNFAYRMQKEREVMSKQQIKAKDMSWQLVIADNEKVCKH